MRTLRTLPALALIVSCTTQDNPIGTRSAQFTDYPKQMFSSFQTQCDGPGEDYLRMGKGSFECREQLPPEATAYLILSFDGHPRDLPRIVTRLSSTKNQLGYRVDADLFFLVPQKDGTTLRVPVQSETLDKDFSQLYVRFGGMPI
ncbi:hypothetical protein [Ruegeria arenilitoris]|uniref:hypothetical protein n=1 Tax=Ruegeria arenilitoris TaxID=1173585 RepID=UPI00147FEA96|nr:hypothetical protein [Ruegeria arenilitoris]